MWHDSLSVDLDKVNWIDTEQQPVQPCLVINYDGSEEDLKDRFLKPDSTGYPPEELDIFYRHRSSDHSAASGGVFSVSDRVTGSYLFEVTVPPELIEKFVHAMHRYAAAVDDHPRYEVQLRAKSRQIARVEKEVFLVYGSDGTLLRPRSLIPDGIEI